MSRFRTSHRLRRTLVLGTVVVLVGTAFVFWITRQATTPPAGLPDRPPLDSLLADSVEAAFSVRVRDLTVPYRRFGLFVQPGDTFTVRPVGGQAPFLAEAEAGRVERLGDRTFRYTAASAPGASTLTFRSDDGRLLDLNVLVQQPHARGATSVGGYRLGAYPGQPYQGNPRYAYPEGFIPLTGETRDVAVSPHFTLVQFRCKQPAPEGEYLLLDERLVLKLELLLQRVRDAGIPARTFFVMSGYRTPAYNAGIGNETTFSAHVYGMAADIYIDDDGDGTMDDLNRDGQITLADAQVLYDLAVPLDEEFPELRGGLGLYRANAAHGPFIHVDVRGSVARW